jgi:hypothetical protein
MKNETPNFNPVPLYAYTEDEQWLAHFQVAQGK